MPSQNIAVQRAVYDALKKERRPSESFTKLFDRLLHERGTLADLSGAWGPRSVSQSRKALANLRGGKRT